MTNYNFMDYLSPNAIWNSLSKSLNYIVQKETPTKVKGKIPMPQAEIMSRLVGSVFIRLAGLSGATAVAMGAYGTHGFYPRPDIPDKLKDVYRTANYYHFLHSIVLCIVPLTRRPMIVGPIFVSGMLIFCGTCYYHALTENPAVIKFTPFGGMLLIIGWLSMMF